MSWEQEKLAKVLKSVLLNATRNGHARAAERAISELQAHGGSPSLDFTEKGKGTVLHEQAETGDKKEQHYSPLMYACKNGMIDTVRILLQSGASPGYTSKEKDSPGLNAFHVACVNGHLEIVQELLDDTSSSQAQRVPPEHVETPEFGWTPVMYAIKGGHFEIVELLGIGPNIKTKKSGQSVLHIAARGSKDKHLKCLQWLCSQVDSDSLLATDKNGWNLLHHACAGGNVATVRWLIEQVKVLPDAKYVDFLNKVTESKSGCTPLHLACHYQKLEVLKLLLDTEGVDCHACTKEGMTGLHVTAIHDSAELAQLLIKKNCPLYVQDTEGDTALHIARRKCSFEVEDVLNEADSVNKRFSEIKNKAEKTVADIQPKWVIPPEIKGRGKEKEYIRALQKGEEKILRCNLLILGEQKVGKTSLYRLITGRDFLPNLESTKGIDNNLVEAVLDLRQLGITSLKEIKEDQHKAKIEEDYVRGIASKVGLTTRKARKPHKPITEEDLSETISDSVSNYLRYKHDSSHSTASSMRQPTVTVSLTASSHTPQTPKDSKQQLKPELTEPTDQQRHMEVQRSKSPPSSPTFHTKVKHETDAEPNISVSPELEQPSGLSRRHHLSLGKKMSAGVQKVDPELYLNTFDFAGQHEYRPMHHCFITGRAVYLVVFNLQKVVPLGTEASKQSLEEIRYWLNSIKVHISSTYSDRRILLVGTHCSPKDKKDGHPISDDELAEVNKKLRKEFHDRFVNLLVIVKGTERIFHAVENSYDKEDERDISGAKLLHSELKRVTDSFNFLKIKYPIIWLHFEEQLLSEREKMQKEQLSQVVGYAKVLRLARNCGLNNRVEKNEEGEEAIPESVKTAMDFFHDIGTIVDLAQLPKLFLDDTEKRQLKGLVLLDPKWLITVMRKIVELPESSLDYIGRDLRDLKRGIASISLLKECWKEFSVGNDQQSFQKLCLILQAFGLIYPIKLKEEDNEAATPIQRSASVPAKMPQASTISHSSSVGAISQPSECFLVPCCLPEEAADVRKLNGITFFFDFHGFPSAEIFHRLICLMLKESRSVSVRHMFSSTCCYFPNVDDCKWRVELDKGYLKVTVRPSYGAQKHNPIHYLSLFHCEYLKEICQGSGLHGIVYHGGPRCPRARCGKVFSAVVHNKDDIKNKGECDECPTEVDVNCLLDPKYHPRQGIPGTEPKPLSDPPQYEDLMEEVAAQLPKKWTVIATKLGLPVTEIERIDAIRNLPPDYYYRQVFNYWETNKPKPYCWATIVEALKSNLVRKPGLASNIESRIRNSGDQ